jgi:aspartyl protease family protein
MHELPRTLKFATVWLLIGLALFVCVRWWQARADAPRVTTGGGQIEIRRGPDGHYHWPGRVNDVATDFLVDTGATVTALPRALAERAGLAPDAIVQSSTAAGRVTGLRARADIDLEGGVRAKSLPVTVLPDLPAPLLGMDVLSKVRFSQQGAVLRIEAGR